MPPTPDFALHRARLLEALGPDEAVLLFGAPHALRNSHTEYRYRPQSDVFWLTGWPDPGVAIFIRNGEAPLTIFCQPKDKDREIWTGYRPGPEGAKRDYAADRSFTLAEIEDELPKLMQGVRRLHYDFGRDAEHDALVMSCVARAKRAGRWTSFNIPETFASTSLVLHELRLRKGEDELAVMRHAAEVSALSHVRAMEACEPGVTEFQIEAILQKTWLENGSNGAGYTPIVAGGSNAACLHYVVNRDTLKAGELLLIDAGCEMHHYTADITRTFPVNGRFTPEQRAVYDHVLRAQEKAIDRVRVGSSFEDVHHAAVRALVEGLVDLGFLDGSIDELIETKAYKRYYMHGTSHWLGLDVHDVGTYGRDGQSQALEPGMVMTVEPGLYFQADDDDVPAAFRGLGIRIEDDVVVTNDAPEVLTHGVPKHPERLFS